MNYEEPYSLDEQISVTMTRIDRLSILAALSVTILGARRADDDNLLRKHTHARDAMLREPQLAVDALRAENEELHKQCEAEQRTASMAERRLDSARVDAKNMALQIEALRAERDAALAKVAYLESALSDAEAETHMALSAFNELAGKWAGVPWAAISLAVHTFDGFDYPPEMIADAAVKLHAFLAKQETDHEA